VHLRVQHFEYLFLRRDDENLDIETQLAASDSLASIIDSVPRACGKE